MSINRRTHQTATPGDANGRNLLAPIEPSLILRHPETSTEGAHRARTGRTAQSGPQPTVAQQGTEADGREATTPAWAPSPFIFQVTLDLDGNTHAFATWAAEEDVELTPASG
ncbi:MAG: hypothetical protein ACRDV9_11545 [Acidimicrobiia bacterium]